MNRDSDAFLLKKSGNDHEEEKKEKDKHPIKFDDKARPI